ncbi:MAG TPA: CBS domain-containing protein [Gaiellaceae bacterium]|nr:CBS domain-containing protein [Gaiellaceae bacterium]
MDVIVSHTNTDFDALGAMLAARRLYPGAVIALSGSLNRNVREFYRLHADELDLVEAGRLDPGAVRRLIVVETVHPERLGELEAVARDPGVEVVVFDHHAGEAPDWVKPENLVLSEDGALTTTMVGILAEREIAVTPLEATVFALGIHEDTGSLGYPGVGVRDAEALAWCLRHGARQEVVAQHLRTPLSVEERALLDALVSSVEAHEVAGIEVLVAAVAWPTYVDGVSNLAHKIVDLTDALALVCLVEMESRVFCVVRTRLPELDAAVIAAALGGGGHQQAASAVHRGPLAEARELVLAALPQAARPLRTAAEIMSRPARFVGPETPVAEAMVQCQRHRQSGILVGGPARLEGHVTRENLDQAIAHGLSHAPVKSVMGTEVAVCSEGTPLPELTRLLRSSDAGRVAVVRDGEVVGVVARSDLLGALGAVSVEEEEPPGLDLRDRLLALPGLEDVFRAVQAVGEGFEGVFLVGGAVRDLLMDEPSFDVDIAVEGDGIAFGRALATALGGRVVPHDKFGTAVVIHPGGRVDVATARTEFYDYPGALPAIEQASIRQDLYRRDFTINALAVSLKGEDFGRLVDYFGGLADLEAGVLRVLHNLSFIDDPTRLFRALRYENRYGFRMEAHTQGLARACVEMELVGEVSSARLRDELEALLSEDEVAGTLRRLAELRLDEAIHPHLAAGEEAVALVAELDALRAEFAPETPVWRPRLAALARRLPPDELYDWFERLRLRRRDADRIADAVTVAPRLRELVAAADEPAALRALAAPHDPDGILLAMAGAGEEVRAPLARYFRELRDVRLEISGADLAGLGLGESPQVGAVLDEVLRRKLNGELDGREAELAAARELIASPSMRSSRQSSLGSAS